MTVSWQFNKLLFQKEFFAIDLVKTILLLRHAKSAWSDPRLDDHERPLNRRGEQSAKAMADHIARQEPRPDLILCSTAMRTRQTLAPLVKRLGRPRPADCAGKGPLPRLRGRPAGPSAVAAPTRSRTVLLIGHNDGIWHLAEALAGSGPAGALAALREKYPTGALAALKAPDGPWRDLAWGSAELTAFVRPRDLARVT